jgi:hypothetical protein
MLKANKQRSHASFVTFAHFGYGTKVYCHTTIYAQVEREIAAIPPALTDAVDIAAPTHLVQVRLPGGLGCSLLLAACCFPGRSYSHRTSSSDHEKTRKRDREGDRQGRR